MSSRPLRLTACSFATAALAAAGVVALPAAAAPQTPPIPAPIVAGHTVALHHVLPAGRGEAVATEAPDGRVFFAAHAVVYVVKHGKVAVSEHASRRVVALAASRSVLYAETHRGVTAYSRTTGHVIDSWRLRMHGSFVPVLLTTHGVAWSLTSSETDQSGLENAYVRLLKPGAAPRTVDSAAYPGTAVLGAKGSLVYERFNGRLARTSRHAVTHRSTRKGYAGAPLFAAPGRLYAELDGAHTRYQTLRPGSFAVIGTVHARRGRLDGLRATSLGDLRLDVGCRSFHTCAKVHVRRTQPPATTAGSLHLPYGNLLLGGQRPAVVVTRPHHPARLVYLR